MKISSQKAGEIILKKGTVANQKIIVIIEGSLKKSKSGITVASKAQAWGEEYFFEANKNKTYICCIHTHRLDDDIVLETDGVIAEISSENFIDCIGGTLEEVIKKNEKLLEVCCVCIKIDRKNFKGRTLPSARKPKTSSRVS